MICFYNGFGLLFDGIDVYITTICFAYRYRLQKAYDFNYI